MTSKSKAFYYNVLLWTALFVAWIALFQNNTLTFSRTAGIQFCYLVFIAFNFYFNALFSIPKFLNQKKYFLYAFTGLLFVIITSWLRAETAFFINTRFYNLPAAALDFNVLYINSLLNIFVWTVFLVAGKVVADKIKAQRDAEIIEKEKIQNELNFLRAQHNPHFLFNSINSVYFQIDKTNADAREMLMLLAEMLRYQLYECSAEKIPIDKEVGYLKNYIQLQKLRLDKNYSIEFTIEPNVGGFTVAPLLMMPLVENAFKYVSHFTDKCNEIKINLSFEKPVLTCNIYNTVEKIHDMPLISNGGIGIKNLQRRLELLYSDRHELINQSHESHYSARLTLKIDEN